MDQIISALLGGFEVFIDPSKRVFGLYLLSSGALAFLAMRFVPELCQVHFWQVYRGHIFWKDLAIDLSLFCLNPIVIAVFASYLYFKEELSLAIIFWMMENVTSSGFEQLLDATQSIDVTASIFFTLSLFVVNDLSKYLVHRLMHENKFLWQFHKLHHSAKVMTPLTVFRTHPIEALLFLIRNGLVQAFVIGVSYGFWGNSFTIVSYFGCNVFVLLFNVFGANLRHSHVHLSYGRWLEGVFISPYQHQLHHSIAAADKNCNYGVALALWDRLGGTLIRGRPVVKLYYGLVDEAPRFGDIKAHYGHPIKSFFQKRS
jgi:sterol desaturase/sphingolipid hydroxylase (fatty acid hydroxylase superfamily)